MLNCIPAMPGGFCEYLDVSLLFPITGRGNSTKNENIMLQFKLYCSKGNAFNNIRHMLKTNRFQFVKRAMINW